MSENANYDLNHDPAQQTLPVPDLAYRPRVPRRFVPKIALIGCGGITAHHLKAWTHDGYEIAALCDLDRSRAEARRSEFAPEARVYTDYLELLAQETEVNVVDIALHPAPRAAAIEAALRAGKHVLSQKPFALDLAVAERLVRIAKECGVRLAVNQNGRWAPYVRWMQQAIRAGLIGDLQTATLHLNWDHSWIKGTDFERIHHIVLYDFAVHWVDMVLDFFGGQRNLLCTGLLAKSRGQSLQPPLLAAASLQFEQGVATLTFDANCKFGSEEVFNLTGSSGCLKARGKVCGATDLSLHTDKGVVKPRLEGGWFNDGFRGAMGELLCAIEEDREPENSGENNLRTLASLFAIIGSADRGESLVPGFVRELGKNCQPQ